NLAGQDQRTRFLPRFDQAAVKEELIQSGFRDSHALRRTTRSASCFSRSARSSNILSARCAARRSFSAISRERSRPYTAGNVIFFCCASLPAVLPRASEGC